MIDDATLERGLRTQPPADPDYVSRITALPPAARRAARGPEHGLAPDRLRRPAVSTWLVGVLAVLAIGMGAFLVVADRPVPVTPVASPSPSLDPFAGFVTEEVEPGVLRLVNDGFREISWLPPKDTPYRHYDNAIGLGPDGSAWLFRPDQYFRLGSAPTYPWGRAASPRGRVPVTIDETTVLWGIDGGRLVLADPERDDATWDPEGPADEVAVDASGAPWVVSTDLAGRITLSQTERLGEPWIGHDFPGSTGLVEGLWVSSGGVVWLVLEHSDVDQDLWRFDGTDWEQLDVPTRGRTHFDVGQDGTVWAWGWVSAEQDEARWARGEVRPNWARLEDGAWTTFETLGDVTHLSNAHDGGAGHAVAPDGSVWFNPGSYDAERGTPCDGVARFDGASVTRFLQPLCLFNIAFGPDGTAWVMAGRDPWVRGADRLVETYVLRPEVAMGR